MSGKISRFQSFQDFMVPKIDESNEVSGRRGWVLAITFAGVTNLGDRFLTMKDGIGMLIRSFISWLKRHLV